MTETVTFNTLAREMADAFTSDQRPDGSTFYRLKDDAPDWLDSAAMREIHEAVDDRLPDDWIYENIAAIAESLAGYDLDSADDARDIAGEIADGLVDCYTSDLTAWLASHLGNVALVTEAAEELGRADDVDRQIAMGQYLALDRMAHRIIDLIESEYESRENEDDE